jgi:hypothetical protein
MSLIETENGVGKTGEVPVSSSNDFERDSESRPAQINFIQINSEHSDSAIDGATHYQRVGFFCAISDNPKEALADEKTKLLHTSQERVNHLTAQYNADIARFNIKLEELKEKLEQEETALVELVEELAVLDAQRDELLQNLESFRVELQGKLQELGDKKSQLIQERQKGLIEELNNLISQLEEVSDKRNKINEDLFEKNKEVLKQKVELLQRFSGEYERLHNAALKYSERLNINGISSTVSSFLIYVGYTCSVAAGWFFSVFALKNQLNNDTTPFSVIHALFGFGDAFLLIFSNPFLSALAFIGIVLLLLALQGGIAWFCQKIIDKKIKKATDNFDFALNYQTDNGLNLNTKIKAENSFIFWLKYIPWFFVVSVIFIALSLGGMSAKISSLDTSLTGLFIGGTIALLASGIVFIYLTKVIEPRLESAEGQNRWQSLWTNFELLAVILLFLGAIIFILFGIKQPLASQSTPEEGMKGVISLIEFTVAVLLTAFTLGYGLRYKGIENTINELEFKLKQFQDAIRDNSRPQQLSLTTAENKDFNERFLLLRRQIFDMMAAKSELAKTMLGNKQNEAKPEEDESLNDLAKKISVILANPYAAPLRFLLVLRPLLVKIQRRIRQFLSSQKPVVSLMEEDEKYFPEYKHIIADLRARILEAEEKLEETEDKISGIRERNGAYYRRLVANKEKIEQQINDYRKEISRYLKEFNGSVVSENAKRDYLLLKLLEGFELGEWYGQQISSRSKIPFIK